MTGNAIPGLDLKRLVAEVSAQHNIRLDLDDPAMAVVTLNRLVFEGAVAEAVKQIRSATVDFEQAVERVQVRAGAMLAHEIRECANGIKREWDRTPEPVHRGMSNESRPAKLEPAPPHQWIALTLLSSLAVFGFGFWVGTLVR
jgi:hypothetical protein